MALHDYPDAMRLMVTAVVLAASLVMVAASSSGGAIAPRVTLIGDSPATGIQYNESAREILGKGISLQLEVYPCRRVAQISCPYDGTRPPTLVEVATNAGAALGETVIVAVGYNDYENQYAEDIETALTALRAAGVKRILWVTLRAARNPYLTMNDAIREAAERNPDVTLVDWNLYSRSHPDWFQDDGIHLGGAGAEAMAQLFHETLVELGIPVRATPLSVTTTTAKLPLAEVRRPFLARLRAKGGAPPYNWTVIGKRPHGLMLTAAGLLKWRPQTAGRFSFMVRAVDANGDAVTRPLRVAVRR